VRIIPAIDLQGGKCVRLYKGDFERVTEYSDEPVQIAHAFSELQVRELHVVDLDGARTGSQQNQRVARQLCEETALSVQLGGGIRDSDTVRRWLASGISRCVIGSKAITSREQVSGWFDEFGPERIVLALDVAMDNAIPIVATHGWTRSSGTSLWGCIDEYAKVGVRHVLCTDVSRDGAMAGPNLELYAEFVSRYPAIELQASGGVRDIRDIEALSDLGVPAAISGKAMLDGKISAAEVATFLQSA